MSGFSLLIPSYAQTNQNLSKSLLKEFPVSSGSQPHDVAPVANGGIVWHTAQASLVVIHDY